jgi:hypothetical protein
VNRLVAYLLVFSAFALTSCGKAASSSRTIAAPSLVAKTVASAITPAPNTAISPLQVVNAQNGGFGYAYGPAIIYTQGVYHAYFCSGGSGANDWDDIRHETSPDLVNWSGPSVLLTPTTLERSNCDPSMVLFDAGDGPYYYLFYSGNITNVQTVNFVARSPSPDGPFLKYTDRGTWEESPPDAHVITWPFKAAADGSNVYGAGESTVVVKNGVLYMWYTDDTNPSVSGAYQYLRTSIDAVTWSAPVLTNVSDVSVDVKYNASANEFVMIEATPQLSTSTQLLARTSTDGINWSAPAVLCGSNCLPHYSSNPGWSSDDQGHVINLSSVLIGFGAPYGLNSSAETWGEWDLWGQLYDLSSSLPTAPAATSTPPSPPPPAGPINGNIDGLVANPDGSYSIEGWACTLKNPDSIDVALYLNAPAGQPGAVGIAWYLANQASEAAVASACESNGTAYRFSIPLSPSQIRQYAGAKIYIHGINPFGLGNNLLANSGTFSVPSENVMGNIDGFVNATTIGGWACVTGYSGSIDVDLYLGGPAGSGTWISRTLANFGSEPAVASACGSNGSAYRFLITVPSNDLSQFVGKPIYIYGISPFGGANNALAGSGTINLPGASGGINNVEFISLYSNQCMDVVGASTADGARVQQYNCLGAAQANQIWNLVPVGSNLYQIVSKNSGKCLDVIGASQADGAGIQQYDCLGPSQSNQIWRLNPMNGGYEVISENSGKCLDITGASLSAGALLQQYDCLGPSQLNQIWSF